MRYRWMGLLCGVVLLAGCSQFRWPTWPAAAPPTPARPERPTLCEGKARIVDVQPERFGIVLATDHGKRFGWWDGGSLFMENNEPMSSYDPQKGDLLRYAGLESNGEIYLRRVWVLEHAR